MNPQSNFLDEKSVLSIQDLVAWKKDELLYRVDSIPKTAILCSGFNRNKFKTKLRNKILKGIKGLHSISKNNKFLISSNFGNGAPELIGICEELRCLGVENFIFIGLAGIISDKIEEGECVRIEKAFSGVGLTSYYSKKDAFDAVDKLNSRPRKFLGFKTPYEATRIDVRKILSCAFIT